MSDQGEGVGEECQSCPRKAFKDLNSFSSNAMRKRVTTIPGLLNTSKVLIPLILLLWAKIIGPGSGVLKKCYAGRLRPEVQPLNLLGTIFFKEIVPFSYTLFRILSF